MVRRPAQRDAAPGLPARRLAWKAVSDVLAHRVPLDDALERHAPQGSLSSEDAGLARAIAAVTFRRFGAIRHALLQRLKEGLPGEWQVLALLATGAAQILFMDVPDHAAVDTSVTLARGGQRTAHLSGLVNAILRRLIRERSEALLAAEAPLLDTPEWLAQRWSARYGDETTAAIALAHRAGASLDVSVKGDPDAWAERLMGHLLPTGSIRIPERTRITDLPGFREGAWWVQDAAAALPARLLGARPGGRVLDLCAAPGGKTATLANAGAQVLAVDRSAKRLERLQENLARLGLQADILAADALALEVPPADAVLLDAPCSATGTIRRHPDVAWSKRPQDIVALADLQRRLLDKAATLVRPGGRLVYCTCSLEPEEGEEQAAAFLARHPGFTRVPIRSHEVGGLEELIDPQGDLRSLPCHLADVSGGRPGLDGFFAARFVRHADRHG
jgi:16S rRNA (cytosine967-C5)-methyltransferase